MEKSELLGERGWGGGRGGGRGEDGGIIRERGMGREGVGGALPSVVCVGAAL